MSDVKKIFKWIIWHNPFCLPVDQTWLDYVERINSLQHWNKWEIISSFWNFIKVISYKAVDI